MRRDAEDRERAVTFGRSKEVLRSLGKGTPRQESAGWSLRWRKGYVVVVVSNSRVESVATVSLYCQYMLDRKDLVGEVTRPLRWLLLC